MGIPSGFIKPIAPSVPLSFFSLEICFVHISILPYFYLSDKHGVVQNPEQSKISSSFGKEEG